MRCFTLGLWVLVSSGYALAAPGAGGEACVFVPSPEAPAVSACEDGDVYRFDVTGVAYAYPKAAYQERLAGLLGQWLESSGLEAPDGATIEFWLAVPEANPGATQARAVLRSPTLNLVWFLSLHPDEWRIADRDVSILDETSYPASFGHRPRQLLVKAAGGDEDARSRLLASHGAVAPEPYVTGWSVYHTAPANERAVAEAAANDPAASGLVARIEVNHIVEWIAMRALAFTFAFSPPGP